MMLGAGLALWMVLAVNGGETVVLTTGERVGGRVIEASASGGVRIQLPDGTVRWIHPLAVERLESADGTSRRLQPASSTPADDRADERAPASPADERGAPPTEAAGAARRGTLWLSFGLGYAKPYGRTGGSAPSLEALVGSRHVLLSLEGGYRLSERYSIGAVFDFTSSNVGDELQPVCDRYGRDCDTATAQLGLFVRRDFAPGAAVNPWASIGVGREWLAGEVFEPDAGGDSVPVLSAPGWQLPRLALGVDLRAGRRLGVGLFASYALGIYDRVTVDQVDVQSGAAVHGWAQAGVRLILGP
jgi:hypothetical protein